MKVWMRTLYLVMALLLVLTAVPAAAAAGQQPEEEAPKDFVILLDCSMSLLQSDPQNLCLQACKNFVDTMPVQDARVCVIAFGYEAGTTFTYSTQFDVEEQQDARMINVIVPFGDLSTTQAKDAYKETVTKAVNDNRKNKQTWTPIGHALAAAVDVLEQSRSADGDACVILISDGVRESKTIYQDEELLEPASKITGQHNWPIYCVELNYGNDEDADNDKDGISDVVEAQSLMDELCSNSGGRDVGRISCATPNDVHIALMTIFNDFLGLANPAPIPVKLPGEYEFEIPYLTSEATVNVFGDSIEYVELVNLDQNTTLRIVEDVETENLIAAVEENSYYSIKMICPEPGNWKAVMHGDADATVLVSNSTLQEMGLKMNAVASSSAAVLKKTDTVEVDAYFAYRDIEIHNSDFYAQNPATLKIFCSNGKVIEKTMNADKSGYSYSLSLADVPTGSFEVMVELRHTMFRNGKKVTDTASFKTQNLPLELIMQKDLELQANVNGNALRVDLTTIFGNPDKDPVTYTFGCASDRTKEFENVLNAEQNYLDITPGVVPGVYTLEVTAKDPDMAEPLVYTFTLTVENRTPVYSGNLTAEDLWLDNWPLQEVGAVSTQLNLDDYFSDPDNMPLTYEVKAADGEEGPLVKLEHSGSSLTILPELDGTAVITVVASDGMAQTEAAFEVTVLSASAVYWKANGIWWIIGIVIFLVLVLIGITMFCTTKARGKWAISVTVNHQTANCNPIALTTCGPACKKRKFTLMDLMHGARKYLTTGNPAVAASITDFFTEENKAGKITLHGVATGNGFKISGVPRNNQVSVTHDGRPVTKATIRGGNVQITLRKTTNTGVSEAVIVLNCAHKGKR